MRAMMTLLGPGIAGERAGAQALHGTDIGMREGSASATAKAGALTGTGILNRIQDISRRQCGHYCSTVTCHFGLSPVRQRDRFCTGWLRVLVSHLGLLNTQI